MDAHEIVAEIHKLEDQNEALEERCSALLDAARPIVDLWGVGCSAERFAQHVGPFVDELRTAITQAEGTET